MRFKRLILSVLFALPIILPQAARADGTLTVTVLKDQITVRDRSVVTIPIVVVCDSLGTDGIGATAESVKQTEGNHVIYGYTQDVFGEPTPLTCDGSTRNLVTEQIIPAPYSEPFHAGLATIIAVESYCTNDGSICELGSAGPLQLIIKVG